MAAFFLFDGDRIVCERVYYDLATMMRQLGLAVALERGSPPPGGHPATVRCFRSGTGVWGDRGR